MEVVGFALLAVTSIIAVVEPASNIAIFVSLTENLNAEEKRKIVSRAMLLSFVVLAFFCFSG
jgi:small neutral amino acid transporter SnatA (MarC family)